MHSGYEGVAWNQTQPSNIIPGHVCIRTLVYLRGVSPTSPAPSPPLRKWRHSSDYKNKNYPTTHAAQSLLQSRPPRYQGRSYQSAF